MRWIFNMENNILKNMKFKFDVEPFYSGDKPSGFKIVVSDLRQKTALAKHIKHGGEVVKSFYYKEKWTIEYDSHSKLFTALIPETYKDDDGNRDIIWTPYPIDEDDIVNIFKIDMKKLRNIYKTTQVDSVIKEEIDSFEVIQDRVELNSLSISEAKKLFLEEMGDVLHGSVLVDNVIYQLWDDFETYITDDDTILDEPRGIPYGIFFIIEFVPGKITMYNPTAKGIDDVDSIGKKPFSYFKGSEWAVFSNLSDLIYELTRFFGGDFLDFDLDNTTSQENLEAMWEASFNSSTVNESAGDVKLRKFLFGKTKKDDKKFPKQSKYYNNELGGYLIVWEYKYNTLTRDSEDKDWSHSEMKKKLPYELQQIITYNDGSSWGREDYYETHTGLFISDGMSDEDEAVLRTILKNKFVTTLKLNEDENDELEVIDDEVQIRSATPNEIIDLVGDKTLEELEEEIGIDSLLGEYSVILDNFDLEDLADWISYDRAYNSKYLRDRICREFIKSPSVHDGVYEFLMIAEDIEKSSRDMSLDFVHACFREDVYDYFINGYSPGDIDVSYYIDELDEDNLKKLEALGFSKEMVEKSVSGDYEDDEPNAAYMDDLQAALSLAASEGLRVGGEAEALSAFESAFESALPIGTSFNRKSENWDNENRPILVTVDFIKNNFIAVWDQSEYYGRNVVDLVFGAFKELFNDNFNFYEPRYGFDGFDADAFNNYFRDIAIEDLESEMQRGNK